MTKCLTHLARKVPKNREKSSELVGRTTTRVFHRIQRSQVLSTCCEPRRRAAARAAPHRPDRLASISGVRDVYFFSSEEKKGSNCRRRRRRRRFDDTCRSGDSGGSIRVRTCGVVRAPRVASAENFLEKAERAQKKTGGEKKRK